MFVMASESNSPTKKKRKLSLSLSKEKKRFNVTTTYELQSTSTKFVPKNTTTSLNWAFCIFKEWVQHSGNIEGISGCFEIMRDFQL